MLDTSVAPDLWFLGALVSCSARVLARSGNGDLHFVGRSLDSMFDLLSGAFTGLGDAPALARVPFSFRRDYRLTGRGWHRPARPAHRGSSGAGHDRHHAPDA